MEEDRKTTEAQRKAVYKYDDKFERVNCRFAVGTKERIRKAGYKSVNDFIKLAVIEKLEHDEKILKYADITQNELEKIKRKCK